MSVTPTIADLQSDLDLLLAAAREAGAIAMRYFGTTGVDNEVWHKAGNSPVSQADFAVDAFLKDTLLTARPDYGWLSEETEDNHDRMSAGRLFVVDPIDGTRGFLAGHQQWCVSIALVENGRPIAGVLECPALGETYEAIREGGARLNGLAMKQLGTNPIRTITGSRKLNDLIEADPMNRLSVVPFIPSLAYRMAMVADGRIDAALARSGAHDWDLAAAELILNEVNGKMTDLEGREKRYNLASSRSGPLVACGLPVHGKLLALAKSRGFLH